MIRQENVAVCTSGRIEERNDMKTRTFYYGWIIVGIAFLSMVFWFGIRSVFSVFYAELLEEFAWSRGGAAGVQATALITYTVMAPIIGTLIDRLGPRRVIVPGIIILSLGLLLCSLIQTLAQFYLFFGVIAAIGLTSIAIVAYSAILSHWFERKRGLASGIALSGMGMGTFLLVPTTQYFITLSGWRLAFIIIAVISLAVLLTINGIFLRHKPQELGLYPDGMSQDEWAQYRKHSMEQYGWSNRDWTLTEAMRTDRFWYLCIFFFLTIFIIYAVLTHHVRFLIDLGIAPATAAFVFSIIGISSGISRIFWGWLSDHIGREITFTLGALCMILGTLCMMALAWAVNDQLLYAFAFLFGIGWGVNAPIFMSSTADLFQGKSFGLIYGIMEGVLGIGAALGAWFPGFIFDRTESYQSAFGLAIGTTILACLFIWLAAPRKARHNN